MEKTCFFESGAVLDAACAGDLPGNLKLAAERLGVEIISRDAWVKISGEDAAVLRASAFFEELSKFFEDNGRKIDGRDFEMLLRMVVADTRERLSELSAQKIVVSPKRALVLPRTLRQLDYVRKMRGKDVVFGVGPAGTGKTYLAMAMAVSGLMQGDFSRIILTRPARESGENLGFLPGSLAEKIMPYLRPLYDALYDMLSPEEVEGLIARGTIELAPLAFMRGRTLNESCIILDEAQNTTVDQMLMFLTRMGYRSKCIITGDPSQSDLRTNEPSGLEHAINTLGKIDQIGFTFFQTQDVMRHALIEKIIQSYCAKD
ncbi:MAG: PhoH family protein [Victivallaceae bacterium]|nr:PhoH family protein [Victivallaceae bacterium]